VNDQNACDENPTGAGTRNVLVNDVQLVQNTTTPGNGPTLVIVGEQDLLTPPWICREVADRIPGFQFEIIKGAGSSHVVPIERPDEFNDLVTKFLRARRPRVRPERRSRGPVRKMTGDRAETRSSVVARPHSERYGFTSASKPAAAGYCWECHPSR
jgi:hypothetical protein